MTIQLLIDAIVRQTTVLIAQLATSGGALAHVANQVFLDLANELEAHGVSRKVSADMFGMALRALRAEGAASRGELHGARTHTPGGRVVRGDWRRRDVRLLMRRNGPR